MVRELLIVVALILFAIAFRACRRNWSRKLGSFFFLAATFCAFYFLSNRWWVGLLGVAGLFLLPWIELLTRIRKMRLPRENRLQSLSAPSDELFPNASRALDEMCDAHFEHVGDAAWNWAGMKQFFRLHWNPEERATAAVCLCEQERITFAFVSITSRGEDGQIYRTTNFPFSTTLKEPPEFHWNHVPCERCCFHYMLADHQRFLERMKVPRAQLVMPDPDEMVSEIEEEMRHQIEYNLARNYLEPVGEGEFRYSWKGLFFLWWQFAKDMVRLC
ncbi:hypothetical protein [Roseibacillus ishigakijimensis]|uniref:Uncharacterized protein n=1 Tax=Roseibacillus ishigakijimensis TaxID=454146 RepID=A0A934RKM1_9BACT|nr:hypothetical protein [Roseibacillus ishigakijimensis]MBK1832450.1 hypothetical protein [Roseibacillus ishigakijimensis]